MMNISPFPNLTYDFLRETRRIAQKIGTTPENLLAVMHFETGGTFSASQKNMAGGSAVGLIQFMPETATSLGTTTEKLSQMTNLKQLEYVEKYLQRFKGKVSDLKNLYLSILYPKALKASNEGVFNVKNTRLQYVSNKGFDTDKDGIITKDEISVRVQKSLKVIKSLRLDEYMKRIP